jgi:hypothetical protein
VGSERRRFLCVLAVAAAFVAAAALAGEPRPMPWHLVDAAWPYPPVAEFRQLSAEVEIRGMPGERVYIAPVYGRIGATPFYFGMQTSLGGRGPGFLFSRWGPARRDDARPAAGGWAEALTDSQSGEGDFAGVRLPYAWTPGRYTFRLQALPEADGRRVELEVFDHQRGRLVEVGALRFRGSTAGFSPEAVGFVELYGARPAPGPLPGFTVVLAPPLVNGAVMPADARWRTPAGVPPLARTSRAAASVVVEVGGPVP